MSKTPPRHTAATMRPLVSGYEKYSGTKKAYCIEHGLNPHTLDYWRNRIRTLDKKSKQPANKFIAVPPPSYTDMPSMSSLSSTAVKVVENRDYIQLHLPDGKRLELPTTISDKLLLSLLQVRVR